MEGLTLLKGIRSRLIVYITLMLLLIVLLLEGVFIAAVHYYYLGSAMETLNSRAATSATFSTSIWRVIP